MLFLLSAYYLIMQKKNRLNEFLEEDFQEHVETIAREIKKPTNLVKRILERKLNFDNNFDFNDKVTKNKYKEEEYKALIGEIVVDNLNSSDFKIENMNIKSYKIPHLSKVVLVHKLREVRALTGFTRLAPPDQNYIGENENNMKKTKFINIKGENISWYPAYEVKGEGIFIELNNDLIDKWIIENQEIMSFVQEIKNKYEKIVLERVILIGT